MHPRQSVARADAQYIGVEGLRAYANCSFDVLCWPLASPAVGDKHSELHSLGSCLAIRNLNSKKDANGSPIFGCLAFSLKGQFAQLAKSVFVGARREGL